LTKEQFSKLVDRGAVKRTSLMNQIVDEARVILPVLLDAGRIHSAKKLQKLFFQMDAMDEEIASEVRENPAEALQALMDTLKEPSD
jgi:hypothetical protein